MDLLHYRETIEMMSGYLVKRRLKEELIEIQ
jgi:hypothetical protein